MRTSLIKLAALATVASVALAGCQTPNTGAILDTRDPTLAEITPVQRDLIYMPPPPQPIAIAVYNFTDQTGQLKPSENVQSLSRAVTQGGTSVLVKALRDAGNGNWFTVVERERLDNLLKERQIIREMRQRYLGERETPAQVLPSLLFAGILLEGGIVGYDTNVSTGGVGARMLAIGGSTQYRTNTVTVYLRAISVKTGEVLANVVTAKSVASLAIDTNVFKFVEFDELLEFEAGVSSNEPTQLALQAAIEKAVYAMIMEGAKPGPRQLWSFYDQEAGAALLARYDGEKARSMQAALAKGAPHGGVLPARASAPQAAVVPVQRTTKVEIPAVVAVQQAASVRQPAAVQRPQVGGSPAGESGHINHAVTETVTAQAAAASAPAPQVPVATAPSLDELVAAVRPVTLAQAVSASALTAASVPAAAQGSSLAPAVLLTGEAAQALPNNDPAPLNGADQTNATLTLAKAQAPRSSDSAAQERPPVTTAAAQ